MNNAKTNLYGCLVAAGLLAIMLLAGVWGLTRVVDYASVLSTNTSNVAIAKLQAQDHITVACMQNSWFTSMAGCIRAGGVNGTDWPWWQWGLTIGGIWLVLMWVQKAFNHE